MEIERRAQVDGGVIVNVAEVAVGAAPDFMVDWPVVTEAGVGWVVDGDGFAAPSVTLAEAKAARLDELAAYRFEREEGGVTFNGNPLATDRVTQAKLTAAYVKAQGDATYTIASWKFAPGVFTPLDATAITAAANAIEAHIQACFTREGVLSAQIMAAADQAALDAVDITTGWPT